VADTQLSGHVASRGLRRSAALPGPLTQQVVAEIGSEMGAAIRRQLRSDTVRRRDGGLTQPA